MSSYRAPGSSSDSRRSSGSGGRSGGRGRGYGNRNLNTPGAYHLHDTLDTPESRDSMGTSIPNSASLSATLAMEAEAAEARAADARVEATIAAEIAVAAAAAAAIAAEAQAAADAAQAVANAAQAADAVAQEDENNAIHDEYPNANKILIHVVPGRIPRFQPSTTSRMNKILKTKVDIEGSNWTKVTPAMKEFYWEEFKKYFIWQRGAELAVRECWRKIVGRRYRDFINDRKNDSQVRDYIPPAVWNKWKADWNTPEALELSHKKRLARMGANGQCSKHTGGSITSSEHAIRFEAKNKRKPTCNELFELMHRKKKDNSFVDEKSAAINAAFVAKKLELSQISNESDVPNDDAIFMGVVGGMNKEGTVYGLGSQSSSILANNSNSGASSSTLPQQISISMLQDFIEGSLTEFGLQSEENVRRRIGKAVESRMGPYERTLLEMQNLLASLTVILQSQVRNLENKVNSDDEAGNEDMAEDDLNDLED